MRDKNLNKSYTSKIVTLIENHFDKTIDEIFKDYGCKTKYNIKFWATEIDRDEGFSSEYYLSFFNLEDAINDARSYFKDGNCVSIEIVDNNNTSYYCCDNEAEEFYINDLIIRHVDKKIINDYVNCWCNHKKLPVDYDLLYCQDGSNFIAIDNTTGSCYTEDFKTEKEAFEWLLGKEKEMIEDIELS